MRLRRPFSFSNRLHGQLCVLMLQSCVLLSKTTGSIVQRTSVAHEDTIVSGMSGRYAQALFALAQETHAVDQVAQDLGLFAAAIAQTTDLEKLVRSPVLSITVQLKALDATLAHLNIAGAAANFIRLVTSKRRLFAIREMIRDYNKLSEAAKGVTRAEVTAASALGDAQVQALKEALRQVSGGKSVDVAVKVDPSIIGGLVVKLGSRMVDGSIKTKLNTIRSRMKEVG